MKTEITKPIKSLKTLKSTGLKPSQLEALKPDDVLLLQNDLETGGRIRGLEKGHLVDMPKKGVLSSCNNWRGIMLLAIVRKVLKDRKPHTTLDKTRLEEQVDLHQDIS